jgi:hypothetical protein
MGTGKFLGKAESNLARAFGPPVEAPSARISVRDEAGLRTAGTINCGTATSQAGAAGKADVGSLGRCALRSLTTSDTEPSYGTQVNGASQLSENRRPDHEAKVRIFHQG